MELLAPAGNIENFLAAVEAGADAVYVGVPGINARNISRDLQLEEIGAMIRYGHDRGKKVYLAANSLILEKEISPLLETLTLLEALEPDALIVQDLAIIHLVRENFPNLRLHASTLMTGHNSDAVGLFASMGCKRVVVARELTLKEIARITKNAAVDVEVFVHGAMCYSFSGLCLFSSFLGGKSSMRGRCVQPCRRGYTWQGKTDKKRDGRNQPGRVGGSFLFSMNDLEGFAAISALEDAGVASLKIEGRLRSANYVSKIVQAYRLVMDTPPANRQAAIERAAVLSEEAMARKTSTGYFFSPQPQQAIEPYHSGNMGIHLGNFSAVRVHNNKLFGTIRLKKDLATGDRLRLHVEVTGERKAFTLRDLIAGDEKVELKVEFSAAGEVVKLVLPEGLEAIQHSRVELYKVDNRSTQTRNPSFDKEIMACKVRLHNIRKDTLRKVQFLRKRESVQLQLPAGTGDATVGRNRPGRRGGTGGLHLEWWLKTDSEKVALNRLPFTPDMLVLQMNKAMVSKSAVIKNYLGKNSRKVIWALPPIILENDLARMSKQIHLLLRSGFKTFQISHLSQVSLFGEERGHLCADYTLNLTNSRALGFANQAGFEAAQLSIEMDRESLAFLIQGFKETLRRSKEEMKGQRKGALQNRVKLGLTVYGTPPLFTSRLSSNHFQFNKSLLSPKGEELFLKKRDGVTYAIPAKPFSLLPYLAELQEMGLDYIVVDISNMHCGEKELMELAERINGFGKFSKLPTFNYLGRLE